jgi:hypothetical protein
MKNKNVIMKKTFVCLLVLSFCLSISAQDQPPVRNRHSTPDTNQKDTTKLKGGALIDTIHNKNKEEMEKMEMKPDSSKRDTIPKISINILDEDFYAMVSQEKPAAETDPKITQLEKDISVLKGMVKENPSIKAQLASLENRKNQLKFQLREGVKDKNASTDANWNTEYAAVRKKVDELLAKYH